MGYEEILLDRYLSQEDMKEERAIAIENMTGVFVSELLSLDRHKDPRKINDSKCNEFDINDFFADFEIDGVTLIEFLNENQTYGTGEGLRTDMLNGLNVFAENIATDVIDNKKVSK